MDNVELIDHLPRKKEVTGHFQPAPFWLTEDMFGGLDIEIAGGEISTLVGKPVADLHSHDIPEIYLVLSPEKGGAKIEIEVEGTKYIVEAPAAFYVPAGARHRFLTLAAIQGSYCLGVLLNYQRQR